jgi:hypothetical protein
METDETNSAIELHDSTLSGTTLRESVLVLVFSPGIVHRSKRQPGVDSGTVWLQDVEIAIDYPADGFQPLAVPLKVAGGTLAAGATIWRNVIPIPLQQHGPVVLNLELLNGLSLTIQGGGVSVGSRGGARYLEAFSSE